MNSSPTSLSLRSFCRTTVTALALFAPLSLPVLAAPDPAPVASTPSAPLAPCPVSGKPANPTITTEYEGKTYAFADEACRKTFIQARENSLYHKLGGRAAIEAAVELFYTKVLADPRINHFFADIHMNKQRRKQKEFLSAAFGGPVPYSGKDLRKAHAHLPQLNDSHFDAVAENLQKTLEELKVPGALISQVMEIAASTRNAVLNRPESTTK